MLKKCSYALIAIMALVAAFSTASSVAAQEARPLRGRWHLRGQIVAIEEDSLTIEGRRGITLFLVDEETHVHIIGQAGADLSDLVEGDTVLVRGLRQEDDAPLARLIVRQPEGDLVFGRIAIVDETSLLLDAQERRISVSVDPETIVALGSYELLWSGEPAGSDVLRVGMRLAAFGTLDQESLEMTAHTLVTQPLPPRWSIGQITAIEGDSITLARVNGSSVTLVTSDNTWFRVGSDTGATLDDFSTGDRIAVYGRRIPGSDVILAFRVAKRG
jgi:hypothetical protein